MPQKKRQSSASKSGDPIAYFWNWFEANCAHLIEMFKVEPQSIAETDLHSNMKAIDPCLCYELGQNRSGKYELVISADGIREKFPIVFETAKRAPSLENWIITALRPAEGFDVVYKDDKVELSLEHTQFTIYGFEGTHLVKLLIHVPDFAPEFEHQFRLACVICLDGGLGEWLHSECVGNIEITSAPADPEASLHASELEPFLRNRLEEYGLRDPYKTAH